MMIEKVLLGSRSFGKFTPKGIKLLEDNGFQVITNPYGHALKEEQLIELMPDISAIITGMDQLTEKVIASSKKLRVISKHGVGIDNIDVKAATKRNIVVSNIPTDHEECNAVADFTFSLMLSIARKICEFDKCTKEGKWIKLIGSEVYRKTLGIIGAGAIGKAVIARAKGFSMDILVYDIKENKELIEKFNVKYVDLAYLLSNSDFVTIHIPLNDATNGLINRSELKLMKKSSYLINTARGGIVNEKDLYEVLRDGNIAGAALDVFCAEPPRNNPLLELKNLVATPHVASYTRSSIEAMDVISAENVISVLKGSRPSEVYVVNKEVFSE